jgi:iron(III) transport system substrate-binding protein
VITGWRAIALCVSGGLVCVLSLVRCGPASTAPSEVVLYTSVDAYLLPPVVRRFEDRTGLKVRVVTDTETTKTTGLVQRLIGERDNPRCDVWWSSEALGTIALARAGVLDPFTSAQEQALAGPWPSHLRASDGTWYGFAQRARVIAYNTDLVRPEDAPRRLRDLVDPRWKGKVGIARPQFGTTRTHVAAIIALHGESAAREWLRALRDNNIRLYDGNASVVRALSQGEIHVGLTDTDDVFNAIRNQWPVEMVFEQADPPGTDASGLAGRGVIVIPNTIGLVRGRPNPRAASTLADFLLSEEVEEMLARSDSRNIPIRKDLAMRVGAPPIEAIAPVGPEDCARFMETADAIIAEYFPL